MESFLALGGLQLPFQRRLSRLYNDTKKSSDFLQEPVLNAEDPEIKALHRKLRIQKDRLVSWGLEWSEPGQSGADAEIDDSLSKAGLSEVVGSIMSTIKDILAEAEPLWLSSKRQVGQEKPSKATGDRKAPLVVWDKGRFQDLVRDLTASIDTLYDLSRTRSSAAMSSQVARHRMLKSPTSQPSMRAFESTRMQAPQQIDPATLTSLRTMQAAEPMTESDAQLRSREVVFMSKQAYSDLTKNTGRHWSPLLLEFADFNPIYSTTGIMPPMDRFEKLSAGLQQDPQRSPGAWSGLPRLLGYFEDLENSRLGLVYHFPTGFNAVSFEDLALYNLCTLDNLLSRPDFEPRLEAKFRLASNLANTIFDMHARGIAHGNLVDRNISFCNAVNIEPGQTSREVDIRRPLISSFDVFPDTPGDESTDVLLHLYRHPLDPRTTTSSPLSPNLDSRVLDLYSLAMVLTSIGLWTRLDHLVPNMKCPSVPESTLGQIAIRCGSLYMKAVQECWNAIDQELAGKATGEKLLSSVQVKVSRYLEACCIIDGVSGLEDRLTHDLEEEIPKLVPAQTPTSPTVASSSRMSFDPRNAPLSVSEAPKSVKMEEVRPRNAPLSASEAPKSAKMEDIKPGLQKPITEAMEMTEKPRLRVYHHIPLPPDLVEKWNTTIMHQINHALRHFYRAHRGESVEISLASIGVSPQATRPTVLVICTSIANVKAILEKRVGNLFDGEDGLGLKVRRGQVVRSRKDPEAARRSMAGDTTVEGSSDDDSVIAANPGHQKKPINGASIGAWIGDRHLPPVSFGGLIIVDEKPYGMTVHHMLDDPDAIIYTTDKKLPQDTGAGADIRRSQAWYDGNESSSTDDFATELSESDTDSETDATSDDSDWMSDDEEEEEDGEYEEPGDIPGVEPGCGEGYVVTQPAFDDVEEDFYPCAESAEEDHLDTCNLGEVYASSGIRRRHENGLIHEIDWALFEFNSERLPDHNSLPRISTKSAREEGICPTTVAPASALAGLEVQCVARTSGAQTGVILPILATVKICGRTSPSHTYQVSSAAAAAVGPPGQGSHTGTKQSSRVPLGIPGDSGAWIVDRQHGRLCGHVLAWSQRKRVAYICPMDVLLLDIAETLEATEIRLPGGDAVVRFMDPEEMGGEERTTEVQDRDETHDSGDDLGDDNGEPPVLIEANDKAEKAHFELGEKLQKVSIGAAGTVSVGK